MKRIAIPYDKNWFLGGNHFFNDFIYSFKNYASVDLKFHIVEPESINNNDFDGILSMRCHFFEYVDIAQIKLPVFLFHDDFHYYKFRRVLPSKELKKIIDNVEIYFSVYFNIFNFKKFANIFFKTYWVPWSISESLTGSPGISDWNNRKNDVLISGMNSFIYPLRKKIYKYVQGKNDSIIKELKSPNYNSDKGFIGENYYRYLKTFKGAIVTTGKKPINFSVMKYFEIPACGCLPFLEDNPELKYLGFIDGVNCVIINKNNFLKKINIIQSAFAEEIAQNAYHLIQSRHTHNKRIAFIASKIKDYYNK